MKRTAALAILFLFVLCAWPSASAGSGDPRTFLVTFTPDSGRLVVASQRGGIKVLSVPDLQEIRSFVLEEGRRLRSAAISPNGRWLAADDDVGDLLLWNLETGEAQPAVPITHQSYPVYVFRPGADTLFVYQKSLRIWDVKEGREAGVVEAVKNVERMTVSPDGRSLVAFGYCSSGRVSGNVCVYAIDEKNVVAAAYWEQLFFEGRKKPVGPWYPADLVYTENGRILLTLATTTDPPNYESRFLKPLDLQVLDKTLVEPERGWLYPGIRSAPGQQLEVVSPDGKWKVTVSEYMKRLHLYRVTADGGRVLEKLIPIP